uniref:RNA polymerase III subunit Rpc25 domain-containing protein n=1 Tax=Oryza glumipatula TaxID=40148 RepID=A0A0D9ZAG6_9ORYZ
MPPLPPLPRGGPFVVAPRPPRSGVSKPFVGEVLVGKISGYDEKGLHVSLDFFNDICIPGHLMQYGTARALDGRWMLKTEDGDELYLDLDDEGSIKGDGLGLLAWWSADEEEGEADAEE